MEVTLLGTGDTIGTPAPGCDCETCERAKELGVERTRFSVHVRNEFTGESLLIDFSPDFRQQFLDSGVALPDAGIVTHVHFDHLDGLGNAYRLVRDLPVHAASETDPVTGKSVAETARERYDYLDTVTVHDADPLEQIETCGFEATLVPVDHPPLVCYGLRLEDPETGATLALTGDTSFGIPERSRDVLRGADLLLADAIVPASYCQYHPKGGDHHDAEGVPRTFGTKHMTRTGALSMAEALDAETVRLVHCSHNFEPDEAFEDPLAVDGERFEL